MHVMDIRPDVITRTGVIQPYSVREIPPMAVARNSVAAFETTGRRAGPAVRYDDIGPEEFAARAKRVANATAAGARMPKGTDPKLIQAARYIREGKPFAIKSAGRTARVEASPANRVTSNRRAAAAKVVVDHRGNKVVVDHRGKKVSVQDHRRRGGYWSIFRR